MNIADKIKAWLSIVRLDRLFGQFTVHRSDFKVKATSAFDGTVRVRDKLKFTFDILAHRY